MFKSLVFALAISTVSAFPGMALHYEEYRKIKDKRATCPYTGATANGLPGTQKGGVQVPCPGDTAHAFVAPASGDIRGPCPGLNAAANHNFISHNGVTNFDELVAAQQNLYNVGYDLAVFLATVAITFDGDPSSLKLSLGAPASGVLGAGLDGHNLFESDTSLTRDDYFIGNGDDYSFNGTLFGQMDTTCSGDFNFANVGTYRYQRYQASKANNPNFYFGPKSLLLFGAATFLYELFPSGGPDGSPDLATISSFFGAVKNSDGTWGHVPEQIPSNWYNRVSPYTLDDVTTQINLMYLSHPVLFGGNTGGGTFDTIDFGAISKGQLSAPSAAVIKCLLYQIATENIPSSLDGTVGSLPLTTLDFVLGKLNPIFEGSGCPLKLPDRKL